MLDANLPTYTQQPSADRNGLDTLLCLAHKGSGPAPAYVLRRASPAEAPGRYALGLFDVQCPSVLYGEVLVRPEPAASSCPSGGRDGVSTTTTTTYSSAPAPPVPDEFDMLLYNPDQVISVRRHPGTWGKSETWDFEVPERSFRIPSASEMDRENDNLARGAASEPRLLFRWKRDGRLSRDLTCCASGGGRGGRGRKGKDPDITVAFFHAGRQGNRHGSVLTVYEPNLRRVEVEDRKGLELALLLSAEVVRDMHLVPSGRDAFSVGGGGRPQRGGGSRPSTPAPMPAVASSSSQRPAEVPGAKPSSRAQPGAATTPGGGNNPLVDAETERLRALVADEDKRRAREKEVRDREEQIRIRRMLAEEQDGERRRREAEVERETERLRREYGVGGEVPPPPPPPPRAGAGPAQSEHLASGALGDPQGRRRRRNSAGAAGAKKKHPGGSGGLSGPHAGGGGLSGLFHRGGGVVRKRSF